MVRIFIGKIFIQCLFVLLSSCASIQQTDYVELGNQYARDGLMREASESYQKAIAQKLNISTARRNLGIVQVRMGEYKSAVRNLEKSMNIYEDNFDANYYLAEAYRGLDQYAEAIFRYQRANKIKANDLKVLKALAWSFYKIRYYTEALNTAKSLAKQYPKDPQATIILSRILLKTNDPKSAIATIRNFRKIAPQEVRPYLDSVEADALLTLNRYDDAEKLYASALKDEPMLAGALLGLGRCYLAKQQVDKAIVVMERAVRVKPKLTEALLLLAKAHEGKDTKKSYRYYQAFLKQAEKDPEYLAQLQDVRNKLASASALADPSDQPLSEKKSDAVEEKQNAKSSNLELMTP